MIHYNYPNRNNENEPYRIESFEKLPNITWTCKAAHLVLVWYIICRMQVLAYFVLLPRSQNEGIDTPFVDSFGVAIGNMVSEAASVNSQDR